MYEGYFGLDKRPFSAIPNADSFVALEPTQEVLDDLLICLVQSRGIAVVTSSAGLGKTLLCKQVAQSAANRFQTVYLSTAAFTTRRALLQAILYEFGIQYEGLSEQEARLKILEAARAIAAENRLLLIIVDEAHLLNSRLFEELRTLADYAPEGEAIIRLILSGQFELEEKLADPAMSAIHQRIGCQVNLEPLSLEDSAALIRERLKIAGASDIEKILTEPALESICRASDGNARCLCQLADHSFLLAFAEEQKPVKKETVLAALDDLKELPLHWNELSAEAATYSRSVIDESESEEPDYTDLETDEFEIPDSLQQDVARSFVLHMPEEEQIEDSETDASAAEATVDASEEIEYSVFEVGAELQDAPLEESIDAEPVEEPTVESSRVRSIDDEAAEIADDFAEEVVIDKYASLDRLQELPAEHFDENIMAVSPEEDDAVESEAVLAEKADIDGSELLETIESLRQEIGSAVDESKARFESKFSDEDFEEEQNLDVVEPDNKFEAECSDEEPELPISDSRVGRVAATLDEDHIEETAQTADSDNSRFSQLFTRLSQRRKKLKQRRAS